MNQQKPLLFLDVDGVINCFPTPSMDQIINNNEWLDVMADGYRIWYRQKVVDFLNKIHREGLAEIIWLTTWTTSAPEALAPVLGLDDFPAIVDTRGSDSPLTFSWWKFRRVFDRMEKEPTRAFVWLDDDLTPSIREAVAEDFGDRGLAIRPETNPALEDFHMSEIMLFLERIAEEASTVKY